MFNNTLKLSYQSGPELIEVLDSVSCAELGLTVQALHLRSIPHAFMITTARGKTTKMGKR